MNENEHYRKLERMYVRAPINDYFKPQISIGEGRAEITVPVRRDFFHAAEAVHGSLYFKCLDDAAFFAAQSLVEEAFVLTVSFNIYLTRPISAGEMRATGKVVHQSRRLMLAEGVLRDSGGQEIARGGGSFMLSSIALSAEIGYE